MIVSNLKYFLLYLILFFYNHSFFLLILFNWKTILNLELKTILYLLQFWNLMTTALAILPLILLWFLLTSMSVVVNCLFHVSFFQDSIHPFYRLVYYLFSSLLSYLTKEYLRLFHFKASFLEAVDRLK